MTKNIVDLLVELETQYFGYQSIESNNTMHVHMPDATTRNLPAYYVSYTRKSVFENITKKVRIEPESITISFEPIGYLVTISFESESDKREPTQLNLDLHLNPKKTFSQLLRFINS